MTKFKQKLTFLVILVIASIVYLSVRYFKEKRRLSRLRHISQYCKNYSITNDYFFKKDSYMDIEIHGDVKQNDVTVISIYFQLEESKHSQINYEEWINNFFISVASPLVILTDKKFIEKALKKRKYPTTLFITDSIWNVLSEIGHKRNRNYIENYKCIQPSLDPEYKKHNPNLYALPNKWILENNPKARVAILTDRKELDKQIERVFNDAFFSLWVRI